MSSNNELVTVVDLQLYSETDKAILVGPPGLNESQRDAARKVWIPSSMVDNNSFDGVGSEGYIEIPRWLADKNDLEY